MAENTTNEAKKKVFPDISPRAWEHPADKVALNSLRAVPGIAPLLKIFVGMASEKSLRLLFLGSAIKCGPKQVPRVNALLEEAVRILDVDHTPEIYITQDPTLNAGAIGVDKPFITLHSGLVRYLSNEELLGVIAHELAHITSGHALYKTLVWVLTNIGLGASALFLPLNQVIFWGVLTALRAWSRKSELSCDRAALLVTQDITVSYTILMKLAGGAQSEQMSVDDFLAQADEYDAAGDMLDSVHKIINLIPQTHPFPVLRIKELKYWFEKGNYAEILNGNYAERNDKDRVNIDQEFAEAGKQYQEDLKNSDDPLAKAFSGWAEDLEKGVQGAAQQAKDFFSNILGR